jgi:hypothetical protein
MLGKERASLGTVYIPSPGPAIPYWQKGLLCKSTASRCLHLLERVQTQGTSHRGNAMLPVKYAGRSISTLRDPASGNPSH